MDAKELQALRQQRLITLRDKLAGGNTAKFARMAECPDTYMRNMIAGRKTIGEKTARKIEDNLDIIPGYLDIPPEKEEIVEIFEKVKSLPQKRYAELLSFVQWLHRSEGEK